MMGSVGVCYLRAHVGGDSENVVQWGGHLKQCFQWFMIPVLRTHLHRLHASVVLLVVNPGGLLNNMRVPQSTP